MASGVLNGDGTQPAEMFPGIANPETTNAPGSAPSRTPPPDAAPPAFRTGTPGGSGNIVQAGEMTGDGRSASTAQPGQEDTFDQGSDPAYTDSGARSGHDHTDPWGRFDWQQRPGG